MLRYARAADADADALVRAHAGIGSTLDRLDDIGDVRVVLGSTLVLLLVGLEDTRGCGAEFCHSGGSEDRDRIEM